MSNHRKNQRYNCVVPVDGKKGAAFDRTRAVDFSKGGVGFISDRRVPVNKEIPIELDLTAEGNPVLVIGKVQWVRRIEDRKQYRIGVSFKDVLNGSKSQFNQYFKEHKSG